VAAEGSGFVLRFPDLFRFRPPEAGAILGRVTPTQVLRTILKPVRRPEAAIEGDGLQRLVASFQHHTRGIDARSGLRRPATNTVS
jgi:hypothetical protein